jgi:serine/threonine protein kinase
MSTENQKCAFCRGEDQTCPVCASSPAPLKEGDSLMGLTIEERVSKSSWAHVYRAVRDDEKRVALKIYATALPGGEGNSRALRERDLQSQLEHPFVAQVLDWGRLQSGCPFLVTEWVDGESLESRLHRAPMSIQELLEILSAVARGLAAIHRLQVVHRDLKPSNIILPASGTPAAVILDFGHSLALDAQRLTDSGVIVGSAGYMAPEQARGDCLDARADMYSLGVILYQGLTGMLPFQAGSAAELLRKHQNEPVVPPRTRTPERDIPEAAEDLCLWLLAKEVTSRPPNDHVLGVTLRSLRQSLESDAMNVAATI